MAKSDRGFASMDPEKQRQICSLGGKAAHARGTAYQWTKESAASAGSKGGRRRAQLAREKRYGVKK